MSVRPALLAILSIAPCYGNQLRVEFERRSGGGRGLNVGQVYSTLDRLERDGCVTKASPDAAGLVVYHITASGRAEARRWLESPVASADARDELAPKVALALTIPALDVAAIVSAQRDATLAELTRLRAEKSLTLERRVVIEALILAAEAELSWLDRLPDIVAAARPYGVDTDAPRRGRPSRHTTTR